MSFYFDGAEGYCCKAGATCWPEPCPWHDAPSPEALDLGANCDYAEPLRHGGNARLLTEAEIREIEREQGHRL